MDCLGTLCFWLMHADAELGLLSRKFYAIMQNSSWGKMYFLFLRDDEHSCHSRGRCAGKSKPVQWCTYDKPMCTVLQHYPKHIAFYIAIHFHERVCYATDEQTISYNFASESCRKRNKLLFTRRQHNFHRISNKPTVHPSASPTPGSLESASSVKTMHNE